MKKLNLLPLAACCFMAASCGNGGNGDAGQTAGIDLSYMDTTVQAGTDFYAYATGGWQKANPMPAEFSRFGTFDQLAENNRQRVNGLVEEIAKQSNEQGSVAQKIGDLYNAAMDSVRLNNEGCEPVKADLEEIAALQSAEGVYDLLPKLMKKGVVAYFSTVVYADEKNSAMNAVQIGQSGLSLGQRDYYLEDSESVVKIREAFKEHVVKMYKLFGFTDADATKGMETVMDVETRLAKAFRSNVELRDPEANYNKMSLDQLKAEYASVPWENYLKGMGLEGTTEVIVGQPASLREAMNIIASLPVDRQRIYLQWKLMDTAAAFLSDDIVAEDFDFGSRVMRGVEQQQPRWKRAISMVNSALGMAVGQMYVEKYFPAEAKTRMTQLVKNLQTALGQRIDNLAWMSDSTKVRAHEKLDTFKVKIGYPDKWKDYSKMEIQQDSYWNNVKRVEEWSVNEMIARAGKPVDAEEWHMSPQTVNAYYNPTTNEICFPAGILQYPFFDMNADDAFNYGAIGVVIGHEMTHGFDDMGRQYDKEGNLNDWWTAGDAERFTQRAKVLIDFFNGIEVAPGVHANGEFTQGENIADHGGLKISYQAFKNATAGNPLPVKDGFTPEQRFYLAYSAVWAANIRDEEVLNRTKNDEHSLGKWRVNGALPQIDTWYEAFGITEKDPMYIAPENRADVW